MACTRDIGELLDINANDRTAIRGDSPIQRLPFLGSYFRRRFNRLRYRTIDDIVRSFTGYPPLSSQRIEKMICALCPNRRRFTCADNGNGDVYHVSDVNQCLFNAIVTLLREVHIRRNDWNELNFTARPNIPNAEDVNLRTRGDNIQVRKCACFSDQRSCRRNRCEWTPPNGNNTGSCTPRRGEGFTGMFHDHEDVTDDQFKGDMVRSPEVQYVNGLPYVKRYRVLGRARRMPRTRPPLGGGETVDIVAPKRIRRGKALRGKGLNNMKRHIKTEETFNHKVDRKVRQDFNRRVTKKKINVCKNNICQLRDWIFPEKASLGDMKWWKKNGEMIRFDAGF